MRVLLVGEAPARGTSRPFEGNSGVRLRELIGDEAFGRLDLANLYKRPMPSDGWKGSHFPAVLARRQAKQFGLPGGKGVVVLLAGKRVAKAFGVEARYFEPCLLRRRVCYVVPHPSGVNRWYNVEINRWRAKQFFCALLLSLEGFERPDGDMDAREFTLRAKRQARESGRVFA
jgi:hypothetical protein